MAYTRNDFGNKKKQGKKSFYLAACTALVCLLAVGIVYYKTNQSAGNKVGDSGSRTAQLPQSTPVGNGAIGGDYVADGDNLTEDTGSDESGENSQAASAIIKPKKSRGSKTTKKSSDKKEQKRTTEPTKTESTTVTSKPELSFNEEKGLSWPVKGDVIMKFSEKNTVYFKTLAQYKSNPAIEISAKEGSKVVASAAGTVTDISKSEETGTMVTTNIGGNYSVIYGQLKDVKVTKGQSIKEGELIGKVAAPTKYFLEEGSNLYFQVTENSQAVDPLLLLK